MFRFHDVVKFLRNCDVICMMTRWRISPDPTPHSCSRDPVGATQKSPSLLFRSLLCVYCAVIDARRQSNRRALFARTGGTPGAGGRARLTLKNTVAVSW